MKALPLKTHPHGVRMSDTEDLDVRPLAQHIFVNEDKISVTGLVPGGYDKTLHDVKMPPTCRLSEPHYGLGKFLSAPMR